MGELPLSAQVRLLRVLQDGSFERVGGQRPMSADVRVVRDSRTINLALGYEMNTVEFAIKDGVPYAIDFLNPAPDFERDRITPFYFERVVDRMTRLVIDRALHGSAADSWPQWEEMLGLGRTSGVIGQPGAVTGEDSR